MKICVIGGGLSGLCAAFRLSEAAEVTVLEKQPFLGGCLSSYPVNDTWIERFYHHCFEQDTNLFDLINTLEIQDRLEWLQGSTGYYADDTLYPLTTPLEILRYPHMTLVDKFRLGLLTLRAKHYDVAALDDVPAHAFVSKNCGEHVYDAFFRPLLKSKFGGMEEQVSAAWLVSRIAIRSNRSTQGERLGYMKGGFAVLINRLAEEIKRRGGLISLSTPASRIERVGNGWKVDGIEYDAVVSTIAPAELALVGGPGITMIPYQGAACLTICLDRNVGGGIYWINIKDPAPYGAVVVHTNMVPPERYGGHIVYLASYFRGSPSPHLEENMLQDFRRRFGIRDGDIRWHRLAIETSAGPVYTTGYRHLIPAYEQQGMFMAGMFSQPNYPERSMEGAVIAGNEVAQRVLEAMIP